MAVDMSRVAVILIDLQRSFTTGGWMQHIGPSEVKPIKDTFARCAQVIVNLKEDTPLLLTRCRFYNSDDEEFVTEVKDALQNRRHTEVIKPNTRIMDYGPESVKAWMDEARSRKINNVVIGGCTTTSCVRESSIQLQNYFGKEGKFVFTVDLNMCAARSSNYIKRCLSCMEKYMMGYDSTCEQCKKSEDVTSPVDKAVDDMRKAGVTVVEQFDWSKVKQEPMKEF